MKNVHKKYLTKNEIYKQINNQERNKNKTDFEENIQGSVESNKAEVHRIFF